MEGKLAKLSQNSGEKKLQIKARRIRYRGHKTKIKCRFYRGKK